MINHLIRCIYSFHKYRFVHYYKLKFQYSVSVLWLIKRKVITQIFFKVHPTQVCLGETLTRTILGNNSCKYKSTHHFEVICNRWFSFLGFCCSNSSFLGIVLLSLGSVDRLGPSFHIFGNLSQTTNQRNVHFMIAGCTFIHHGL